MSVTVDGTAEFLRTENGWIGRFGTAVLYFGDKHSSIASAQNTFPDAKFSSLKQVHSDRFVFVKSPNQMPPEADAQISTEKDLALVIQTADCLPILLTDGKMIAAVHAGWRGLEMSIAEKVVKQMRTLGAKPDAIKAVIGPHIAQPSFEVGRDVSERLLSVYRKLAFNPHPLGVPSETDPQKRYVDLSVLAKAQLIQAGVPEKSISIFKADTFKDETFFSYRRDKEAPGRQLSFVVLR